MSPGTLPVVPPKKLTIALPSLALKQLTSVLVYVEVNSSGSDNIILSVAEQPRPSIMFKPVSYTHLTLPTTPYV